MNTERSIMNECYSCVNKRSVPGNCHIQCVKPDVNMTGNEHGMRNGWFIYPFLFDPIWKTAMCNNYESKESTETSVSESVSVAGEPK